jgi:hypothetical protein
MQISGTRMTYEPLQQSLHVKTILPEVAARLLEIAGPRAVVSDPKWSIFRDRMEYFQRASLQTHGAGTPDVLRLSIARVIGLPSPSRGAK